MNKHHGGAMARRRHTAGFTPGKPATKEATPLRVGELVRLVVAGTTRLERGALGIVVDGPREFPSLFRRLRSRLGADHANFAWIRWLDTGNRCRDGAYMVRRFARVRATARQLAALTVANRSMGRGEAIERTACDQTRERSRRVASSSVPTSCATGS